MRVAIIFFGIARGLKISIESIQKNIYAHNRADGISFYSIASLNLVESVYNPRTDEKAVPLNYEDVFLLNADAYALVRQDDAAIAKPLAAAQIQPDRFNNGWISIRNMLHQLASLQRGWAVLETMPAQFDYFLFLRPDLIYLDEIRLRDIVAGFVGDGNIALPPWHSFGGFNDRFALADRKGAELYANRLNLVAEYCNARIMHPESFLAHALQVGGCKVCSLPVRAERVRAHGAVRQEDFTEAVIDLAVAPKPFSIQADGIGFLPEDVNPISLTQNIEAPIILKTIFIDGLKRVSSLNGAPYLDLLQALHATRPTARYLEIGTQTGKSLTLARGPALAIDPDFRLNKHVWNAKPNVTLFETTSDDFFAKHDPRKILGGAIDLAFIDGMHLSEFVFRDFVNVEKFCSPDALIVLHDCIPHNFEMTERRRDPAGRRDKQLAAAWTGDVWRVVPMLREQRPDLHVEILDCPPTGLVLISNLNPAYRMPPERLNKLLDVFTTDQPSEAVFWSFIASLSVVDSRKHINAGPTPKASSPQWLEKLKRAIKL